MKCLPATIYLCLNILILVGAVCLNNTDCPVSKPYCTTVGCVFQCPENSFVDEMKCVEDCEERFIYNQNCVTKCPETHQLILENVVLGHSSGFTKLKFCSQKCPDNTFKYQGFCEASCPNNALFSLDDNYCLDQCPSGYEFLRNISKDNRTVSIRCMLNCSESFPVRRGSFCIERCSQPLVQYKKECLDFCPADANLTMKTSTFKDAIVHCIEACPDGRYLLNHTCVSSCPDNFAVYNESVCVSECPANAPFQTKYIRSTTYFYKGRTRCVAGCQELYVYNKTCVLLCPGYSLNTSCVDGCPLTSPFVCDQKQETLCRNSAYNQLYQTSLCQETCPANMYAYNSSCVSSCPAALKSYNNTCVEDCPQNAAYIDKSMYPPVCVVKCPNQLFIDGYNCVRRCPENKLFILANDSTCRENCPSFSPFVCDKRLAYDCHASDPSYYRTVLCLNACPGTMYVINNTCAYKCPDAYKLYNNTCVDVCPIEAPMTEIKYCSWFMGNCHPQPCVSGCSSGTYTDGLTCVDMCPDDKYALEINKTCVDKCPESQPLIHIDTRPQRCQNQCLHGSYFTDGKCVNFCRRNYYMFNNSCVRHCPRSHPFIKDRYCVPKCPADWYINKQECVNQCPLHLYTHNFLCLESCPSSHPLVRKEIFLSPSSCVEKCGGLEVSQEGICIYRSECNTTIIFDDKCLQKCPHGYKWINTHVHLATFYPGFPICHRQIALSILFGLSLMLFLRFSYLYWKCFFSPEDYIKFFCCCSWICCKKESDIVDDLWVDNDCNGSVVLNSDTELDSYRSIDQLRIHTENSEGSRREEETGRSFAHGPSAELTELKSFENYAFDDYDSQIGTKTKDNNAGYELPSTSHSSADFTDLKTINTMSDTSVTVEYSGETSV